MRTLPLSPASRSAALAHLREHELDILVVGGGVVGAGSALDAATRGLSVGIVEARDWASGTSSRSSKLIHGGLRYLEMLDFGLVAEALAERSLIHQRLAPHLVRPVRFLYPLRSHLERPYVGAGLALYDTLSLKSGLLRGLPRHRQLTRKKALALAPALRRDYLVGGITYWDCQVDDARHTMMLVRTAVSYGAHAANRTRVVSLLRAGERVIGARLVDLETGERFDVRAKQVLNATGVWTDETQALANTRGLFNVRASKGVHLLVPRDRIRADAGVVVRTETSVLFLIPWGRHWLIGTTDTEWDLDKAHPAVSARDVSYLLERVNQILVSPLRPEDVEGVFAGLRPLLAGESEETSKLSREHLVGHPVPGLVVVAGGKYTTYRVMAADAVDEAVSALDARVPASSTASTPLVGAEGFAALWNQRRALALSSGLHLARIEHLLGRQGSLIHELLELLAQRPELSAELAGCDDYIELEVVYAVLSEGARHLDDVLCRRTRASIESWDRGTAAAPRVAELMAPLLGWDDAQREVEIEHYLARVAAEREAQAQPDDATADAARLGAPDVVPVLPA